MLQHKKYSVSVDIFLSLVLLLSSAPVSALVPSTSALYITELQTSYETAGQEFVELYNASDVAIDLADSNHTAGYTWKLQYYTSTKAADPTFNWETTKPSGTISLTGIIDPHEFYLLSSTGYVPGNIDPDQTYSPHFADTGGALRLVKVATDGTTLGQDQLGWLQVTDGTTLPGGFYVPHPAKGSLQRKMNQDDTYVEADGSITAFSGTSDMTPKAAWQETTIVEPPDSQDDDTPSDPQQPLPDPTEPDNNDVEQPPTEQLITDESPQTITLLPPQITELLPNPAAPQTDGDDEYVELFNPNDASLSLDGYVLQTGSKDSYSFDLAGLTMLPHTYAIITSGHSSISLANAAGHARLLNDQSIVISQTDDYTDAPDGEAWALIDGHWQWTTTPTPTAANLLTLPTPPPAKKVATKTTKAKTTTAKKSTAKVKAATTKKASSKTTKTKAATATGAVEAEDAVPPIHTNILVGAGVLAVGYAVYEYRQDIGNRVYQFRRYRAARRAARSSAQGR